MTDSRAREMARTVFDRPVVVEAGAGTGKTTALVARALTWCLADGWERARAELGDTEAAEVAARVMDGVVAITFTEAAAAEMADRIGTGLAALARGDDVLGLPADALGVPAPALRVRCRAMLESIDRLVVSTIHAFCRRLLAAAPLDAGLHPDFDIDADGSVLAEAVYDVVEEQFTTAFGSDSPLRTRLLSLAGEGIGPEQLAEALTRLVGLALPASALDEDPLRADLVETLLDRVDEQLADLLRLVSPPLFGVTLKVPVTLGLEAALRDLRGAVRAAPRTPRGLGALAEDVERLLPDNLEKRLWNWSRGRWTAAERRLFSKCIDPLQEAAERVHRAQRHLLGLRPERLDAARRVLRPMLEAVETAMAARGAMTFGGLLRDARDLLALSEGTRRRVAGRIEQLLVDEFQDTDPVQCDLVRLLALEGPKGSRPGLFVVGDPKQSIYGWRSADLVAYADFLRSVEEGGGEVLPLTVNRRSKRPILDEVDRIVAPIMEADHGYQPRFEPLVPGRSDADDPPAGPWDAVEHWVSWRWDPARQAGDPKTRALDAAAIEARALAADIARLANLGVPLKRVALLLRSTGDLDVYLSAMREAGIPYVVERDRSYFRRREIIDAAALVRCILEPADHLALLTTLRSPAVGVPDAALVPLWLAGLPRLATELFGAGEEQLRQIVEIVSSVSARVDELPDVPGLDRIAGWDRNLVDALAHIGFLRESWGTAAADTWVEQLRRLMLVEVGEAARYLGSYRLANLDRFFRRLSEALERGGGNPQTVLRLLRTSVEQGKEAEEARPGDAADRAVRVMTIHKSKGLDFDHVYVGQIHKSRRWGEITPANLGEATRARKVEGRWEYELFGARTPAFDAVVRHEQKVEQCERVRLLYVAMTRAKERLVVMGRWPEQSREVPVPHARSMVELLGSRSGGVPDLQKMIRGLQASGEVRAEPAEVRWVFPGLIHGEQSERPRRSGEVVALPTPAEVDADRLRLSELRRLGRERMNRPVGAAASDEAHRALKERIERTAAGSEPVTAAIPGMTAGANLATAIGTAVHRSLELLDAGADPEDELVRLSPLLRRWLAASVPADRVAGAATRAEALLQRFCRGDLGARFRELGPAVVARELPVLTPPPADDTGPVGYVAGAVDMVYRDPADDWLVVVDYKTDYVPTEDALQARADAYASQGRAYARAVADGLGLKSYPRVELWFVAADRVVRL